MSSIREQIAKKRASLRQNKSMSSNDFVFSEDPFKSEHRETGDMALRKLVEGAKSSGKLILSGRGFEVLPNALFEGFKAKSRNVADLSGTNNSDRWWEAKDVTSIFLNDNKLRGIAKGLINEFPETKNLDMKNNLIETIPDYIHGFANLSRLDLSHNKIHELPLELFLLPLIDINLSHNEIKELPSILPNEQQWHHIKTIDLKNNQIEEITSIFCDFSECRELNISHNKVKRIDEGFIRMNSLTFLSLSHNQIKQVPFLSRNDHSVSFSHLNVLDLSFNQIEELGIDETVDCGAFEKLNQLLLSHNRITNINNVLLYCYNIKVLSLSHNKLESIPDYLLDLKEIKQLDLSYNLLKVLPPQVGNLTTLNLINLDGNYDLKNAPRPNLSIDEYLKRLRMRIPRENDTENNIVSNFNNTANNERDSISQTLSTIQSNADLPTFDRPTSLTFTSQEIDTQTVRINKMDRTTEEINELLQGNLPFKPKTFEFKRNRITQVPNLIYYDFLVNLDLSFNKLTNFSLSQPMPHLNNLIITNNQIKDFPFVKSNFDDEPLFPKLITLNIGYNSIYSLPSCPLDSTNMPLLTSLLVPNNKLETIIPSLPFLTSIRNLDLSNNSISKIPPEIACEGSKINSIELWGNPFLFPRHQILQRGSSYVLEYLRSRIPKRE